MSHRHYFCRSTLCPAHSALPILNVSANTYNQIMTNTYDPGGELTNDGTYTYGYNAESQMTTQGGTTWTFDGNGNRVIKSDGTLSWPALDGGLLGNTNYYGTTYSNEYIYFNGVRVATNATGNTVYYFFTDQIGSLKTVTTSNGTVCYDSEYTPEGYRWAYTSTCGQEFGLAGMKLDASTPTYRTLFREYAPNQGRWMSPDPLGGDVGNPQSLNRYAYVTNNPVALTDPLGLDPNGSAIHDVCTYFPTSNLSPCDPFSDMRGFPGIGWDAFRYEGADIKVVTGTSYTWVVDQPALKTGIDVLTADPDLIWVETMMGEDVGHLEENQTTLTNGWSLLGSRHVGPPSPFSGAKRFAKGFAKGFVAGEVAAFVAGCGGAIVGTAAAAPEIEANPYVPVAVCFGGGLAAAFSPPGLMTGGTVGTLEGLWDAFEPVFEPNQTVPSAGR